MIKKDYYITRKDGVHLYKTYSDEGLNIRQIETNKIYAEAVDVENASYTYEEIPQEDDTELTDSEALAIILGDEN